MSQNLYTYLDQKTADAEFLGQVIERYQPKVTNYQEDFRRFLTRNNIPEQLVIEISNALEHTHSFESTRFDNFGISILLDYLKKTHKLYLNSYFAKIDQSIDKILHFYPESKDLMSLLSVFFVDYRKDVVKHIAEEDEQLFPYIELLVSTPSTVFKTIRPKNFSILKFKKQHDQENEDTLVQIIQMISQEYAGQGFSPLNILLRQIQFFERDLRIHSKIEEEVLLPKAEKLERLKLK